MHCWPKKRASPLFCWKRWRPWNCWLHWMPPWKKPRCWRAPPAWWRERWPELRWRRGRRQQPHWKKLLRSLLHWKRLHVPVPRLWSCWKSWPLPWAGKALPPSGAPQGELIGQQAAQERNREDSHREQGAKLDGFFLGRGFVDRLRPLGCIDGAYLAQVQLTCLQSGSVVGFFRSVIHRDLDFGGIDQSRPECLQRRPGGRLRSEQGLSGARCSARPGCRVGCEALHRSAGLWPPWAGGRSERRTGRPRPGRPEQPGCGHSRRSKTPGSSCGCGIGGVPLFREWGLPQESTSRASLLSTICSGQTSI